ncbi:matrilysin-like [Antechinus flavipes]|uniref:matrilysin-like n=1 Tax=Antechinus flavipes TaxID=38775 RepID=UPI0022369079|nr:matrilysin-like [Antechinus flavipes]
MLSSLLIVALFLPCCLSFPVPQNVVDDLKIFKSYFDQFLFTKESQNSTLESQLRFLQRFYKLEETGLLDEPTKALIRAPRCGVRDVADYSFFPGMPRIENNPVTYRIVNYPSYLEFKDVAAVVQKAAEVWSSVTPLKFRRVNHQNADISLGFYSGYHGDFASFDGRGNIVAHAFAPHPYYPGEIHFDSDEEWTFSEKGTNLFLVAVHEIGHSLGLGHSWDPDSIMYPPYQYQDTENFKLSADDIRGIQILYPRRRRLGFPIFDYQHSKLDAAKSSSKESKISLTQKANQ